jgi:hypothetical protein
MDDLLALIAGDQPAAASSPKSKNQSQDYSNLITDSVLNGLKRTESGGNPLAVNKDTKALGAYQFMPDTAAALHKQGIKFNVFDEGESRDAAKQYLTSLVNKNGGDLNKALAQYGGFVTKDPSKYVSSVLANPSTQQQQTAQPSSDPLLDLIAGSSKPKANLSETGAVTTEGNLTPQQMESYVGSSSGTPAEPKSLLSVAKGGVMKFLNQNPIKEGLSTLAEKTQLGPKAAGEFDTLFGVVPATYGAVIQGLARTANTPQAAEAIGKAAAGSIEKPMGRIFGVTENPAYQKPLNGITEPIAKEINRMANVLGLTPEQISERFGIPVEDVKQMAVTSSFALPKIASPVLGEVGSAVKSAATTVAKPLQQMAKELEVVRPGQLSKAEAQAQFEAKQTQQGAAAGAAQPESLGTAKPTTPETPYTELSYSEKGLPLDEQSARSQTISRVLGADHKVDLSAIEGKGKERATNYAVSNTDTPMGNYLKENFNSEQKGLTKYGENLVKKSGGTLGLDEATLYKRGNTQLAPFEEYGNLLDTEIGKLYAERNKTAKEVPIQANSTKDLLSDDSVIQLADNEKLAKATKAKMNQLGIMDKDGNLLDTDAFKAEQLRKWLNSPNVWTPQNAGLHRLLKESIDKDVFAHADKAIYEDARALFGLRKDTLDNPKGIATILDESGPNGINRKVDVEKVANKIAGMGVDQFTHIIDTLDKMPAALQPKAMKAKGEIKAQFLNQAIAQKSPASLTKYMQNNQEVMNRLFTPSEMAEIRDYHNASHILATDTGYKGSAVQKINVEQKLLPKIAGQVYQKGLALGAEALTGGSTLGTAAMVTNELLGQRAIKKQAKAQAQAEQKAFENTQKRFVPIKDLINKEQK